MSNSYLLSELDNDTRKQIKKDLTLKPKETVYNTNPKEILVYEIIELQNDKKSTKIVQLPFHYSNKNIFNLKLYKDKCISSNIKFSGKLLSRQEEIMHDIIDVLMNQGSIILALYTGFGKSILTIFLACFFSLPTIILSHRTNIMLQWEYYIKTFTNGKLQKLTSKNKIDKSANFYIINPLLVSKRSFEDFSHIGMVIVDEVHIICTENLIKSLYFFNPVYLIGLSATPNRPDGMDKILDLYFGTTKIERNMFRLFHVYNISTGFCPPTRNIRTTVKGTLDWGSVLEAQAENKKRNEIILNCIKKFKTKNILVLCKRVSQAKILLEKCEKAGEDAELYVGSKKFFNVSKRILVSTYQKAGVGFDFPKLNCLIVASDLLEYFQQYVGRIFRTDDTFPLVIDFEDNFGPFKKHLKIRNEVCESLGGIVYKYNL